MNQHRVTPLRPGRARRLISSLSEPHLRYLTFPNIGDFSKKVLIIIKFIYGRYG